MTAQPLGGLAAAPTKTATGGPPRWFQELDQRGYPYAIAVSLAALAVMLAVPGAGPSAEAVYAPLGVALLVGSLLTVRLTPGHPGAALVLLPAMAVDARFGLAGLPAIAYASLIANLVRGVRGPRVLSTASHTTLAYAAADLLTGVVRVIPDWIVFAVAFAVLRVLAWQLAARIDRDENSGHTPAEQPELMLSLALAPVGALPLLAGERLGDGAFLLATAALLALLFVVREAANLATARAEMEVERDRLIRANALQEDIIQLITHELRNPLTLVLTYTQMCRRAAQEGTISAIPVYLANIERAGKAIQRVMENLLQFSKLERSDELPPAEPIVVRSLIGQVVADLAPLAKQKNQTLIVSSMDDVPVLHAVPLLLRDALSNLVSNAVKYTPDGGEITVWAERGPSPSTVVLGVRDTGIGLSEEDVARLFTKFFRSSDPRVQRERGSGLGLALTHAMVSRMGGKLEVASRLDEGTSVKIILPEPQACAN